MQRSSAERPPALQSQAGRWELNFRFLIVSSLVFSVVAAALLVINRWQRVRIADALLVRSAALQRDGRWADASMALFRFLSLRPDHAQARIQLAECFDKGVVTAPQRRRAIELYFRAIGVDPENLKLRRRQGELLLAAGEYASALAQAEAILAQQPNAADARRLAALAGYGRLLQHRLTLTDEVRDDFEQALAATPGDVYLAAVAAQALRELADRVKSDTDRRKADEIMDQLVAAAPSNPQAWLARHHYRVRHGLANASGDLEQAQRLAPQQPAVLMARAQFAVANGQWDQAEAACTELAKSGAHGQALYRVWGDVALGRGDEPSAIRHWEEGTKYPAGNIQELHLRLATLFVARQDVPRAASYLDLLEESVARPTSDQRRASQLRLQNQVRMLRASWHVAQEQWAQATPLLKAITHTATVSLKKGEDRKLALQAWQMLAHRETVLDRFDLATEHLERAISAEPTSVDLRLQLARSLVAAGQLEAAQKHVEFALQRDPSHADALLFAAELQLAIEARLPASERNPERAGKYISLIEQRLPESDRTGMVALMWDMLAGRVNTREDAARRVTALAERFPDSSAVQDRAVLWLERLGEPGAADAAMARLAQLEPTSSATQLRQAELWLERKRLREARQALSDLERRSRGRDFHRVARLWQRYATLANEPDAATLAWARMQATAPDDLYPVMLLAEQALSKGDWHSAQQWEQRLHQQEGDDGAIWRYIRARRLLSERERRETHQAELGRLSKWLLTRRAGWPQSWIIAGMLAESTQSWDRAIEAYQQVVTLDATRLGVCQRLLQLLYQQGRYSEVDRFVAVLAARGPLSADASLVAIGSAAAQDELQEALVLAEKAVAADANNVTAGLWLAHLQLVLNRPDEAEAALNRLLTQFQDDPRVWGGKLALYQARGDRAGFSRTLRECEAATAIAKPAKLLLLAQGYELLGQPEKAAANYEQAIAAGQRDVSTRLRLASVQLQYDPRRAEATLRDIRSQSPDSIGARRMLAITLAARRKPDTWPEINQLLFEDEAATTAEDNRLAAVLRLQNAGVSNIGHARKHLEDAIAKSPQPVPQDRLLLAALHEQEGNVAAAREQYRHVVEAEAVTVEQLQAWGAFCIRQYDIDGALAASDRLAELVEDRFFSRQMKALAYHAGKRQQELDALLAELVSEPLPGMDDAEARKTQRLRLATLYDQLGLAEKAERQLRGLVEEQPAARGHLVGWLIGHNKGEEALQLALADCRLRVTAETVGTLAMAISRQATGAKGLEEAEDLVTELAWQSRDPAVLGVIGNLRIAQQRNDDAVNLLRRLIELAPDDYVALNNLAALLADRPGASATALECIDRAISAAPRPLPFLLDTRAKILLHAGRIAEALIQLERIVERWPQAESRIYFHLALAYDRSGRHEDARSALAQARERGLDVRQLTPGDRELCLALDRKLASTSEPVVIEAPAALTP